MTGFDIFDDGVKLFFLCAVNQIRQVFPDHGLVRRNHHHFESVDLLKLNRLGISGTSHAGESVIEPEQILEGNRGKRLVLLLNGNTLFGLYRLMQPLRPSSSSHHSSGKFINNDDLSVSHDVIHVSLKERVCAQPCIKMMHKTDVANIVKT